MAQGQDAQSCAAIDFEGARQSGFGHPQNLVIEQAVAVGVQVHLQGAARLQGQGVGDGQLTWQGRVARLAAGRERSPALDQHGTCGQAGTDQFGTVFNRQRGGCQSALQFNRATTQGGVAGVSVAPGQQHQTRAGLDQLPRATDDASKLCGAVVAAQREARSGGQDHTAIASQRACPLRGGAYPRNNGPAGDVQCG